MATFLKKTSVYLAIVIAAHVLAVALADGAIDPFYLRFTTPRQPSLIVGTSRVAQGIRPKLVNASLSGAGLDLPVFNFAFTLLHSPFGRVYLDAIEDKVDPNARKGLYIVAADPFSVSSRCADPEDEASFRENDQVLGRMPSVNGSRPNLDYFFNLRKGWGSVIIGKIGHAFRPTKLLHEDGWLEITVPMSKELVASRTKSKIDDFKRNVARFKPSRTRFSYLEKTVRFLGGHGRVFIVRMPAAPEIVDLENQLMPDFDEKLEAMAERAGAKLFDFSASGAKYAFTDGSHLHKDSSARFTMDLVKMIKSSL